MGLSFKEKTLGTPQVIGWKPTIDPPKATSAGQLQHKLLEDKIKLVRSIGKAGKVVIDAPAKPTGGIPMELQAKYGEELGLITHPERDVALTGFKTAVGAIVKEYQEDAPVRKSEIRLYQAGARELSNRGQDATKTLQAVVEHNLKEAMGPIYEDSPARDLYHFVREKTIERETREKYEWRFPDLGLPGLPGLPKFPDILGGIGKTIAGIVTAIAVIGVVIVVVIIGGKILSSRR